MRADFSIPGYFFHMHLQNKVSDTQLFYISDIGTSLSSSGKRLK